jgi:hypothetical protein
MAWHEVSGVGDGGGLRGRMQNVSQCRLGRSHSYCLQSLFSHFPAGGVPWAHRATQLGWNRFYLLFTSQQGSSVSPGSLALQFTVLPFPSIPFPSLFHFLIVLGIKGD